MTALLLAALIAAGAANIALVTYVAERLSTRTRSAAAAGELVAA